MCRSKHVGLRLPRCAGGDDPGLCLDDLRDGGTPPRSTVRNLLDGVALDNGLSVEELSEATTHLAFCAGSCSRTWTAQYVDRILAEATPFFKENLGQCSSRAAGRAHRPLLAGPWKGVLADPRKSRTPYGGPGRVGGWLPG